jgi:hypothetical protein
MLWSGWFFTPRKGLCWINYLSELISAKIAEFPELLNVVHLNSDSIRRS